MKSKRSIHFGSVQRRKAFCVDVLKWAMKIVHLKSECAAGMNLTRSGNMRSIEKSVFKTVTLSRSLSELSYACLMRS